MNKPFQGDWICSNDFADLIPRNMYHKQHEAAKYTLSEKDPRNIHMLFRREFVLTKKPGEYRLRISADDYGKYSLNGTFFGQGPAPDFLENYQYNEFNVTELLRDGSNVLMAHVYYQGLVNRVWISGDLRMGLIADLLDPDGNVILSTDRSWEVAWIHNYTESHIIGLNTQFAENFDSRMSLGDWEPVAIRHGCGVAFAKTPAQPVQLSYMLPEKQNGHYYDFGQEITASLRLRAKGRAGDTIRILCGEESADTPERVRYDMRCYCLYDETWTLDEGEVTLEQFDYKAFRYLTLIPSPGVEILEVAAVVRHGQFDDSLCTLECDDPVLKAVFELCKNGVKYGTQEIFTDCPSREKGQYAGDMTVTSASHLWLTGDVYMLEKGIRAHAASSAICPGMMAVLSGSLMQEIADYSLQFPLLLLRHYSFTKDKSFLRQMLPYAEGMLEHFGKFAREDGLLESVTDKWNLVDWPKNMRDGYDFELSNPIGPGVHNVINAFYIGSILKVQEIKDILEISYEKREEALISAFIRAFYRKDTGLYADSETSDHCSLHSNILPVFFSFAPEAHLPQLGAFLKEKGMACGVYMSWFYLKALCRLGEYGYVYDRITATDEHSWYQMIIDGGTCCMEAWGKDQKFNTSFCHPWSSGPISILVEDLLSVSYDGSVGPCHLPPKAGRVKMQIPTANGLVLLSVG